MNYQHWFELVVAEQARIQRHYWDAMAHYDQAIALAKQHHYWQDEAIAHEVAGRFYLLYGKEKIAQTYLQEAYYGYARWGAKAKIDDLLRHYPQWLTPLFIGDRRRSGESLSASVSTHTTSKGSSSSGELLDISAVMKASQAISGELQPDQLTRTLIQVVLENAGAEQGSLILWQSHLGDSQLMRVAHSQSGRTCNLDSTPVETCRDLPRTLIHYVFRTGKTIVVDDMENHLQFAGDAYFMRRRPKSVLCVPLVQQKQPIGVLYLENNLTVGAFTCDRLQTLNVLCAQAAISLENANLYENLKASNQNLQQSLEKLQKTQAKLIQATEKLQHDAFHDALTDLPNRAYFIQLLNHVIQLAERYPEKLYAVLFLDLDRFKVINDSLGHAIGDEFLKQVAKRLQDCVRSSDVIARFGGDEFVILLEQVNTSQEAIEIVQRIHNQFILPFTIDGYEIFSGTSIGIALSTMAYQHPTHILRDADIAMYHAKAQGRNRYAVFNPSMQAQVATRLQLEGDLRRALEAQEFHLHYQPIISLATGRLRGFEALVRWYHPKRGHVSPAEFIPISEEMGLILPLGWWVLQEACQQFSQWLQEFPQASQLVMNVNLSAIQLKQVDLLDHLEETLQATGIPRECLKLEITESCILETVTSEAQRLKHLKDLGIRLCIDDFGTGYSSLSRLHEFPIDTLKIDRSFVKRLRQTASETIKMIVTLAHSLGMDVVAEGIETETDLEILKNLECEFGQGYLFSRPIQAQEVRKWIACFAD
jgi:diguanylate cyclase (GGDEF)-like protein